jgi:hypothetical protein
VSIRTEITPLLTAGSVGVVGSTLFWAQLPDMPANAVGVYEYLGQPISRSKQGAEYGYHPLQVTVRNEQYDAAMSKAMQIFAILGDRGSELLEGATYDYIRARQPPFADPGGKDANGRFRVLCNYVAKRRAN